MNDDRFDIHQWRADFLTEQEKGGSEGDEKLEKLIGDLNNTAMNLTAVLGQLPNYTDYIMKPNDPANDPEHNKINVATVKDAFHDSEQYLNNLQKVMQLLKGHVKKKYNFETPIGKNDEDNKSS